MAGTDPKDWFYPYDFSEVCSRCGHNCGTHGSLDSACPGPGAAHSPEPKEKCPYGTWMPPDPGLLRVKCIDDSGTASGELVKDTIYRVTHDDGAHYTIKGIKNPGPWYKTRFETVSSAPKDVEAPVPVMVSPTATDITANETPVDWDSYTGVAPKVPTNVTPKKRVLIDSYTGLPANKFNEALEPFKEEE